MTTATCSEAFPLRDLPLMSRQKAEKGKIMANRKRYHSISLKLTDEELELWNTKHKASGLSKTDYLLQAIRNSEVRIYSISDDIAPLIHEIRKIGTNLNQLAYYSNIGQDERVKAEIGNIRHDNEIVMMKILEFLNNPKFKVK